jgi:plastocyanin
VETAVKREDLMRRLIVGIVAALTLVILPAAGSTSAAAKSVKVLDNAFKPKQLTVAKGTRVKWKWTGALAHNVTVVKGPVSFASPTQTSGTFSKKMKKAGTYKLVCTLHEGMTMTLKVK